MHRRTCKTHKALLDKQYDSVQLDDEDPDDVDSSGDDATLPPPTLRTKPGLRLPDTVEDWKLANSYFHSLFADRLASPIADLNEFVSRAQDEVYNYFEETFGTIPSCGQNAWVNKYKDLSFKQLKKELRMLKR